MMRMSKPLLWIVAIVSLILGLVGSAMAGEIRFDFESGKLEPWRVAEGGFDQLVCNRARFHNTGEPYNKQGDFFLTTLETSKDTPNDRFTGVVESPVFILSSPTVSFLVGGGSHTDTYIALCVVDTSNGHVTEVLQARGANTETMQRVEWDAAQYVSKPLLLRVVDHNTGGWGHVTFDDFLAEGAVDGAATSTFLAAVDLRRERERLRQQLAEADTKALRNAIDDLLHTFPKHYAKGARFLEALDDIEVGLNETEKALAQEEPTTIENAKQLLEDFADLRRTALLANPLLTEHPILFVVRHQYKPDHHNTATIFQTGEINTASFQGGGALKIVDLAHDSKVTTLLETADGLIRDPEVHFDGEQIVFAMRRNIEDDYHIYEIQRDGTGLTQLTSAPGVADIDPLYLPDDTIAFSSTREPKYCMCNRHIMANLFRMDSDGANIHQIGKSTLFEGHGTLLPDGRILYDRWEYVDRNFGDAQGLWTVNPDGTNHALFWGNNTKSPGGAIDGRAIPGTDRILCIFGSCHDRPWGSLALLDRRLGLEGRDGVVRTWPAHAIDLIDTSDKPIYGFDTFRNVRPRYEDPFPLSDKYFLCTRSVGEDETMAIYLIDVFGNEILVHAEEPGCYDPMPLGPHARPSVIPPRRDFENAPGRFYVADVYEGTHMKRADGTPVARGAVKALRVVESPQKRFWTHTYWSGQGVECPAMNWHDFCNKRVLGTVPVEEDGSAYFEVPADTFVYFQLLDKRGMMIQSMRSGTMVQSGETTGCVGCHESRQSSPTPARSPMPLALRRPPNTLNGWYGPPRLFNYRAEVQPVFDAHCVQCHDFGKKAGSTLNLAGDRTLTFNVSYNDLWLKPFIHVVGAGPSQIQPAYSWGSHASKLADVLRGGHPDVPSQAKGPTAGIDAESRDRIITWLDLNAPYYPTYASAYPANLAGRAPLDDAQLARLSELTGVSLAKLAGHASNQGAQVCFDRPAKSPCLQELAKRSSETAPDYLEALDIVRAGQAMLAAHPRADTVPNEEHPEAFAPCPTDAAREQKYVARQAAEDKCRMAIAKGDRIYDSH